MALPGPLVSTVPDYDRIQVISRWRTRLGVRRETPMPGSHFYLVKSLGAAAALMARGHRLDHVDRAVEGPAFAFALEPALVDALIAFYTGQLPLNALTY